MIRNIFDGLILRMVKGVIGKTGFIQQRLQSVLLCFVLLPLCSLLSSTLAK
jgi:hypothetical protein